MLVAIPGRKVKPQSDTCFPSSVSKVTHNVTTAIPPGARADRVVGVVGGPQAEPIVVFGGENDARKARVFGDLDPLSGVELRGVEDRRVSVACAPLGVREGIGSEVEEHGHVPELPLELGS